MEPSITDLETQLFSKKSGDRRKAARKIGEYNLVAAGEILYKALVKELLDSRTWETQCEMINSLGLIDFKPSIPLIKEICNKNLEHDMVTIRASEALIRLDRKNLQDGATIINLLKDSKFSVTSGVLNALGRDKMVPPDSQKVEIIQLARNKHLGIDKGYGDPRYGLAVAAAGWDKELVKGFLEECLLVNNQKLQKIVTTSLKSIYIKEF